MCVIFICILSHTYTFPHSTYESSSSLSVFFNLTSILSLLSFKSQKLEFRESGFKAMSWNYNSWDQNWRQSQWKSDDQWNEDKSNASSAWDWQQPKRQSEADWSTSTPKKLRTENYQSKWDHIGSPTGYPPHVGSSVDKNLPPTFQSDSEFYDKNEIWGKKLPRKVMTTEWSKSHGLAGRDLTKVSLPELLYMGWQNHGLRYLGQGWFTGAVLTRNIRESVLVEKVLKQVRQKGIDIDGAALHVAKTSGHAVGPNMTNAEKANLIDLLAQHILAPLQTNKEVESEMLDLRRQLEEAQITIGKLQSKQPPLPELHQDEKEHEPTPAPARKSQRATDKTAAAKAKADPAKDDQTAAAKSKADPSKESHSTAVPDSIQGLITHVPTESQKVLGKFPLSTSTSQGFSKWLGSLPLKPKTKNRLQDSFKTVNNVLKQMSKDDVQALPDVAAKYGCTVRLAGQMSDPILVKLLLVAIELLE